MTSTEGHSIVGNQRWVAHTWKSGGGGAVAVYGSQEHGKKNVALPVIAGH